MDEENRKRRIALLKVAVLAIETYDPQQHGNEESASNGLEELVVAYGRDIAVTSEEATQVLFTSRLCDYARR